MRIAHTCFACSNNNSPIHHNLGSDRTDGDGSPRTDGSLRTVGLLHTDDTFRSTETIDVVILCSIVLTMLMIQHVTVLSITHTTKLTLKTPYKQPYMLRSKPPPCIMLLSLKALKSPIFPILHASA